MKSYPIMKIFPYVLLRVGGGPFAAFKQLCFQDTLQITDRRLALEIDLTAIQQSLSDHLYDLVRETPDNNVRSTLIGIRRDIFNGRSMADAQLELILPQLTLPVFRELTQYLEKKKAMEDLWQIGASSYERETVKLRKHFCTLIQENNLQYGLVLSSQNLLRNGIPNYLKANSGTLSKSERRTEQSLIKYLSRIYAKTSPFSAFTNLAVCQVHSSTENSFQNIKPVSCLRETAVSSHIRLNSLLYKYLSDLITKNRDIYRWFRLRPNPTLARKNGQFIYLTNSNNIESFQRIMAMPVLEVFQKLTANEKKGAVYQEVVETIVRGEYIDASSEEIASYLDQLIALGFLEFNIGVSGIDPDWDIKLQNQLHDFVSVAPLTEELIETLKQLRRLANQYGQAALEDRQQILHTAYEVFKSTCLKLHEAAGLPEAERLFSVDTIQSLSQPPHQTKRADKTSVEEVDNVFKRRAMTGFYFRPEQIFYEDTTHAIRPTLREEDVQALVAPLHHLLQGIHHFQGHEEEHITMQHYFLQTYGEGEIIPFLRFYEDYYRDIKKAGSDSPYTVAPLIQEKRIHRQRWLEEFGKSIKFESEPSSTLVSLSLEQVDQTNDIVGIQELPEESPSSYGMFIQPFYDYNSAQSPSLMGVVNSIFPGFGKMISRFLHLFDPAITNEIRLWNGSLTQDALLMEAVDASIFNANLHPPLMPFEVHTPGSHNNLTVEHQIPITELAITFAGDKNRLRLIHTPSKKTVYLFDLGFQGHRGRSQLFVLLEKFTLVEHLSYFPLVDRINQKWSQKTSNIGRENSVQIYPRITLAERLILQRQSWHFPKNILPFRESRESNWAYFVRLQQWRKTHQIPNEVFVYVIQKHHLQNPEIMASQRVNQDDYKPQYICFSNPLLVTLFEKLLYKTPSVLKLEEMLPNSEQLLSFGPDHYVTEFAIQWYKNQKPFHES